MSELEHVISIVVDGREIRGWSSYEISVGLTDAVGTFTMRIPFSLEVWDLCAPDRPVRVLIDGIPVLTGYLDDEDAPPASDDIVITGRCKVGSRLVPESVPAVSFAGLGIRETIAKLAAPWFSSVVMSNARNRRVVRGKGRKVSAGVEPVRVNARTGTQIEPGSTRWAAIERLLEQAGYLAWSSGDGRELIIGRPHYDQDVQFRFFKPAPLSDRAHESTVIDLGVRRSTADRYSRIVVVGSGTGTDVNYGATVASRYGEAKNNATPEGDGADFSAPRRLVLVRAVRSTAEARELAGLEMARRDGHANMITVIARAHGQRIAGSFSTLFAPDCLASVEDERTGTAGTYLVEHCTYRSSREGEETEMRLVPRGAELTR